MPDSIQIRRCRRVVHYYVSDTVELHAEEFPGYELPDSATGLMAWVNQHQDDLMDDPRISELTRLKLSKLDFYIEDRDRRIDETCLERTDEQ